MKTADDKMRTARDLWHDYAIEYMRLRKQNLCGERDEILLLQHEATAFADAMAKNENARFPSITD